MKNHVRFPKTVSNCARRLFTAGIAGILCISLSGCAFLPKEEQVLAPPLREPQTVNYDTEVVKKGTIEKKVTAIGSFISVSQSDLYFKYRGGHLKKIYVNPGDKIKPGDLVAELETDNLENEIKQQELNVRKAQMAYSRFKSETEGEKEPVEVAQTRIQLSDLERLYNKVDTAVKALNNGLSIKDVFPDTDIENLKSQIEQKKLSLVKAEDSYKRSLDDAALNVEIETLKLTNLLMELEKSRLVADIGGDVVYIDSKVNPGDNIPTFKMLVRVADPRKLQLQYSDSLKALEFKLGMEVDVKIESVMYKGEVVMTPANAPLDADENTKKSIRIRVDKMPEGVEIGDSGDISLITEKRENVLVIPRNAVKFFIGRKYVQILEDGVKKERDIETGIETVSEIEVIKGIKEGDRIIMR